jgi:hypothetical protein
VSVTTGPAVSEATWQRLNFRPLRHGQSAFLPTRVTCSTSCLRPRGEPGRDWSSSSKKGVRGNPLIAETIPFALIRVRSAVLAMAWLHEAAPWSSSSDLLPLRHASDLLRREHHHVLDSIFLISNTPRAPKRLSLVCSTTAESPQRAACRRNSGASSAPNALHKPLCTPAPLHSDPTIPY